MFSFGLYPAYYHVEMFYAHTECLGFSWILNGKQRYLKFLVLPFDLKSALYIFTIYKVSGEE